MSSFLQQAGIYPDLVIYRETEKHTDTPESIVKKIMDKEPTIIAFSVMTFNWHKIKNLIFLLRENFNGLIIAGGYHAILAPEEILSFPGVDAVCTGEGEQPILELIKSYDIDRQKDFLMINGLIFKGQDISPESLKKRWLVEKLEDYPYMDYQIFDTDGGLKQKHLGILSPADIFALPVVTGRGCPYRCTYCSNSALIDYYGGVKKFVRRYQPELAIKHLKTISLKYNPQFFEFLDETFTLNRAWIKDFCFRYKKEISVPFIIMSRIDMIDEPTVSVLADAGLKLFLFGIESGDEEYRKKYLNRKMSNDTIIKGTKLLKKYGIMLTTFNIFGMPFETKDTINKTIALNYEVEPDASIPFIYQPLPGTELARLAYENNMVSRQQEDRWDFCSPSLDTPELPADYVSDIANKFREKFAYQNIQDVYTRLKKSIETKQ